MSVSGWEGVRCRVLNRSCLPLIDLNEKYINIQSHMISLSTRSIRSHLQELHTDHTADHTISIRQTQYQNAGPPNRGTTVNQHWDMRPSPQDSDSPLRSSIPYSVPPLVLDPPARPWNRRLLVIWAWAGVPGPTEPAYPIPRKGPGLAWYGWGR